MRDSTGLLPRAATANPLPDALSEALRLANPPTLDHALPSDRIADQIRSDQARSRYRGGAQLRARWLRSSDPGKFDYSSSRWHAEAIPTLQRRRFCAGWMYPVAAGVGRQCDSQTDWRAARAFEAAVATPEDRGWYVEARFLHSSTASTVGCGERYRYNPLTLSFVRPFE